METNKRPLGSGWVLLFLFAHIEPNRNRSARTHFNIVTTTQVPVDHNSPAPAPAPLRATSSATPSATPLPPSCMAKRAGTPTPCTSYWTPSASARDARLYVSFLNVHCFNLARTYTCHACITQLLAAPRRPEPCWSEPCGGRRHVHILLVHSSVAGALFLLRSVSLDRRHLLLTTP